MFLKDGFVKIDEIKACLESENFLLFTTYVHALKSASANIGAEVLSKMAETFETAGRGEHLTFIKLQSDEFLSTLEAVLTNIKTALAEQRKTESQAPVDAALLKAGLVKLSEAVDDGNLRNIKTAAKDLQPFAQAAEIGGMVDDIIQGVLVGDYEEAEAMIKMLLREEM
jgi:HPt (histidine-containing phosphotransfer) domain-containing protein